MLVLEVKINSQNIFILKLFIIQYSALRYLSETVLLKFVVFSVLEKSLNYLLFVVFLVPKVSRPRISMCLLFCFAKVF